ncbi:MAG: FAD-binding protein [Kangiellaceae bacterium]|nr:FAD-binding protein [Kangiellaceae bacterium]
MSILVIAEHNNQDLAASTFPTLSAAKEIGGDITIVVMGHDCQSVVEQAAACESVQKVLKVAHIDLENSTAESLAAIVVEKSEGFTHILASATTSGKNFMPRVGAKLDVQPISDITAVENESTFLRPIYAGNAIATVESSDAIKVITVRSTGFDAAESTGGSAEIIEFDASALISTKSKFVSQELTVSERPELTAASIIISGGRGMQSGDNFHLLESIADKLGAAVGASRAAVDAGFVPNDYQVGQTGKIVAPDLYIAVGISGAIQHLAGMKDSKVIVAINKDEEAPIFQVADYGLVADLFKVLPELNEAL